MRNPKQRITLRSNIPMSSEFKPHTQSAYFHTLGGSKYVFRYKVSRRADWKQNETDSLGLMLPE